MDRDKLHYIDFEGEWFSVRGPSIVPRPPQGQPLVTALAHATVPYRFGARSTDVVFLDETASAAQAAKARLDERAGAPYKSDALVFVGTAAELADLLLSWQWAGLTGYRLRPGRVPYDLEAISRALVPELQRRGAFRDAYEADTLRGLLGLARPANRFVVA